MVENRNFETECFYEDMTWYEAKCELASYQVSIRKRLHVSNNQSEMYVN